MKSLILIALGMGSVYVLILRCVANFITRDTTAFLEALKLTDDDTKDAGKANLQTRKEFLHRQTIEDLTEMVCENSSSATSCYQDASEEAHLRSEVVKLEYMLDKKSGDTNLQSTFLEKPGVVNRKILSDTFYKRILTEILLKRERQVPYLANHKEQTQEPKLRATNARFSDEPMHLLSSIAIGIILLVVTQYAFGDGKIRVAEQKDLELKTVNSQGDCSSRQTSKASKAKRK